MASGVRDAIQTVEIEVISDVFVTGIAAAEDLGGCVRIVWFVPVQHPQDDMRRAIKAKLVIPISRLTSVAAALGRIASQHGAHEYSNGDGEEMLTGHH